MTEVVTRETPIYLHLADSAIVKIIPTGLLNAPKLLSRAPSIKTAWSLTLAKATGAKDVRFGSTVWGRNSPISFTNDVIGSWLSHIPTRDRYGILGLLH